MPKKQDKIERFTQFFDKDWKTCRSAMRDLRCDDRSYDPSNSWDGRSDNPQTFSKLQSTELPHQPNRPITMTGTTVIPLETHDGLPIFENYGSTTKCDLPLTIEQRDLAMKTDLSCKLPIAEKARDKGRLVQVDATPSFRNMEMRSPRFNEVAVPVFMKEVGPQCDKQLMTPAQRREVLDFEIRTRAANEYMRKAVSDRTRTKKQITGITYHRGVLGYDSTNNDESEVYGDKAQKLHSTMKKLDDFHSKRADYMAAVSGNHVASNLKGVYNQDNSKQFQSKGKQDAYDLSFDGTYNTLFGQHPLPRDPERCQKLRDQDMSGKTYNFIQHTNTEYCPSRPFHRQENKILSHPSQVCIL